MKSDCNAEHAGRALLCFTVILWYCFIDGKHGDHNVSCHPMTVTLSPGCSLLHQERTASLDRGQGPLHLWMLSLNALDFWLTDRIAEGGRVDLLVLRNHSNSCVWGYPVVCFFCKSSNYKWLWGSWWGRAIPTVSFLTHSVAPQQQRPCANIHPSPMKDKSSSRAHS